MPRKVERLDVLDAVVDQITMAEPEGDKALGKRTRKSALGQFLTDVHVADLMASMFTGSREHVRLLDAGAGAGALTHALVKKLVTQEAAPHSIHVTAYEFDPMMIKPLQKTLAACQKLCKDHDIEFTSELRNEDFLRSATTVLRDDLFKKERPSYNMAIINPPYRKISSTSTARALLRSVGIETSNLYTAFAALTIRLLDQEGEMVAITPRSFCNGPYFRPFRSDLLQRTSLNRLHIFDSRKDAFKEDKVLQENVIYQVVAGSKQSEKIIVSNSSGKENGLITVRNVPFQEVVTPDDPQLMFHLETDLAQVEAAGRMRQLNNTLKDLGLTVSTGRVVDFRAEEFITQEPTEESWPLIYPSHFSEGYVQWPKPYGKKPNSLARDSATDSLLVPRGMYVLVKRFSSKEERRRVVAALYDPEKVNAEAVAFENHLNYYHRNGKGLEVNIAKGLAAFLNSTMVDNHFRRFSGHTQVNATDLRSLSYPEKEILERIGESFVDLPTDQSVIDALVDKGINGTGTIRTDDTTTRTAAA
jgi:adenine-specific DNA-methyltransferase